MHPFSILDHLCHLKMNDIKGLYSNGVDLINELFDYQTKSRPDYRTCSVISLCLYYFVEFEI